jgi:CRP-like cAMP-binding protein
LTVGAAAALNGRVSLNRAIVQIAGTCLCCAVAPLKAILQDHSSIRSLLGAHEQALLAQAQQSAACNATHVIESRLSRWLLRAADLHGSDELPLTQEYIAQMLGVRRTSVTLVARTLQEAGMIRYKRGNIKLLDREALLDTACECYETVKRNYEALLVRPKK